MPIGGGPHPHPCHSKQTSGFSTQAPGATGCCRSTPRHFAASKHQ